MAQLLIKLNEQWMTNVAKEDWDKHQITQDKFDRRSVPGDIIVVRDDNWKWGKKECPPLFVVVKVPDMNDADYRHLERAWNRKVNVTRISQGNGEYTFEVEAVIKSPSAKEKITVEEMNAFNRNESSVIDYEDNKATIKHTPKTPEQQFDDALADENNKLTPIVVEKMKKTKNPITAKVDKLNIETNSKGKLVGKIKQTIEVDGVVTEKIIERQLVTQDESADRFEQEPHFQKMLKKNKYRLNAVSPDKHNLTMSKADFLQNMIDAETE